MESTKPTTFTVTLSCPTRVGDASYAYRALRAALKHLGRVWGLRCVAVRPGTSNDTAEQEPER